MTKIGDIILDARGGEHEVYARVPMMIWTKDKDGNEVQSIGGFVLHTRPIAKELPVVQSQEKQA